MYKFSIDLKDMLHEEIEKAISSGNTYRDIIDQIDKVVVEAALSECGYNQSEASRVLDMNRGTFRKKMKKHL